MVEDGQGSVTRQLQPETITRLEGLLSNRNNPHVLGLDAREIFFQNDKIILVEGQEDVVLYPVPLASFSLISEPM